MPQDQGLTNPLDLLRQTVAEDQTILKLLRGGKIESQEEIVRRSERFLADPFHCVLPARLPESFWLIC